MHSVCAARILLHVRQTHEHQLSMGSDDNTGVFTPLEFEVVASASTVDERANGEWYSSFMSSDCAPIYLRIIRHTDTISQRDEVPSSVDDR